MSARDEQVSPLRKLQREADDFEDRLNDLFAQHGHESVFAVQVTHIIDRFKKEVTGEIWNLIFKRARA
jgi:hypothetical protein